MGNGIERKPIILPGLQGYAGVIAKDPRILVPALDNAKRGFLAIYQAKGNLDPAEKARKELELTETIDDIVRDLNRKGRVNAARHRAMAFMKQASDIYTRTFDQKA